MTKHKLDQLFKDKLEHLEVSPSEAALEKFQSKINRKTKSSVYLWLAASVSLILGIALWALIKQPIEETGVDMAQVEPEVDSPQVGTPNEPVPETSNEIEAVEEMSNEPLVATIESESDEEPVTPKESIELLEETTDNEVNVPIEAVIDPEPKTYITEVMEEDEQVIDSIENFVLTIDNEIQVADNQPIVEEVTPDPKPLPKVRITYISGRRKNKNLAQNTAPIDSTTVKDGAINKILNSARNLANGTLIADLRDVKENFFNKNDD